MKSAAELEKNLMSINRRSYPAYKDLRGSYQFQGYQLNIDHVQGDPFASPSKLSIQVKKIQARFPEEYYKEEHRRIALQDYLTRQFGKVVSKFIFQAKGSGKSGLIGISRCGQEVLDRTAFEIKDYIEPGRDVAPNLPEVRALAFVDIDACLYRILEDTLAYLAEKGATLDPATEETFLYYKNLNQQEVKKCIELAEDQHYIRRELTKRRLIAFVANGSILPRESGVSQKPMKGAIAFEAPESMEVEMELPHRGKIKGMGIPEGITLIVGGGYHGKSTLLKALEQGIYNHVAGDGREYVITSDTAMKIRAEDGRCVSHINISPFINDLPNKKDTVNFSTEDASGSTSQAANVVEAVQSGAKCLLIDEDTCATNFMVRDELMQAVVSGEQEPITPFTLQAGNLYQKQGISIILVAGSSGSYFYIADHVLQMDNYRTYDITEKVKTVIGEKSETGEKKVPVDVAVLFDKDHHRSLKAGKMEKKRDQVKIKQFGKDSFSIGRENVDLKYVEQILDAEQTTALAYCLKNLLEEMERKEQDVDLCVEKLWSQIKKQGLASLCKGSYLSVSMAQIRKQDIYACLNRYRGFIG